MMSNAVFRTFSRLQRTSHRLMSYRTCYQLSITNILQENPDDNKVILAKGWVKAMREHSDVTFINLSDGSSPRNLQVVIPTKLLPREASFGSCIEATGIIQSSPGKGQSTELVATGLRVLGPCDANGNGYCNIHTPILTSNDCEGAGEVFYVQPEKAIQLEPDEENTGLFFNVPAYLTVSGQLHLEVMTGAFDKVYTFNPTFRAENARGRHHLNEFYMIEAEQAFTQSLEDLSSVIERLVKSVTTSILNTHQEDVEFFSKYVAPDGHRERIEKIVNGDYIRMPYSDAITVLQNAKEPFTYTPEWGTDLQKEHERYLVKYCDQIPVFITDFPTEIKPFYARENPDYKTVAAVDLLGPDVGELCGGSLREERYSILHQKLQNTTGAEKLQWYLDLRKFGSAPHGGFGIGFERYLQTILGIANIKDTIPFPRSPNSCKL